MFVFQTGALAFEHPMIYFATGTGKLMGGMSNLLSLQPYLKEGQMELTLKNTVKLNEFAEHLALNKLKGDVTAVNLVKGGKSDFTIHFTNRNLNFSNDAAELTPGIMKANLLKEGYVKVSTDEKKGMMELTVYDKDMKEVVSIRSDSHTDKSVGFYLGLDEAKTVSLQFSAKTPVDVRTTGGMETALKRIHGMETLKSGPEVYYVEGVSGKTVKLDLSTAKLIQSNWEYSGKTMVDFGFEVKSDNGKTHYLTSTEMINLSASLEIGKKSITLRGASGNLKGKPVEEILIDPHTHEIKFKVEDRYYVRENDDFSRGYKEVKA